jgi:hypothetical protein
MVKTAKEASRERVLKQFGVSLDCPKDERHGVAFHATSDEDGRVFLQFTSGENKPLLRCVGQGIAMPGTELYTAALAGSFLARSFNAALIHEQQFLVRPKAWKAKLKAIREMTSGTLSTEVSVEQ